MELIRIGDKIVSKSRLLTLFEEILRRRGSGETQEAVADAVGVERSFVSHLERLGELRRGNRVTLLSIDESHDELVQELASEYGIERVCLAEAGGADPATGGGSGTTIRNSALNMTIDALARLHDYDVVIFLGPERRVPVLSKIIRGEVLAVPSFADPGCSEETLVSELDNLLSHVTQTPKRRKRGRFKRDPEREPWIFKKRSLRTS